MLISSNQLTLKLCCLFPVFVLVSKYIYKLLLLCLLCACLCVRVCFICCRNLCALCVLIYLRLVWFQGEIRKNNVRIEKYILCRYYTRTQTVYVWGKCSAYFVSANALHFLLTPFALLITHTPRSTDFLLHPSSGSDKRYFPFFILYIVYIFHLIHAPLSAGNLAIDTPPSSSSSPLPTSHTLPPFDRPHCQPAASDVI